MIIKAFDALRPPASAAAAVSAPPYDTVSESEARAVIDGNPLSFLRVTRPEADMPPPADPHSDEAYARAHDNFLRLCDRRILVRDGSPCLYIYSQQADTHVQTGIVGCCSAADYMDGTIVRHEKTRFDKEDDRVRLTRAIKANAGPVFLAHRRSDRIEMAIAAVLESGPDIDFIAHDGVRHRLWVVKRTGELVDGFVEVPRAYIADGHHRAAAAVRVAAEDGAGGGRDPEDSRNWFMAILFPADKLRILPYNRCVLDLNGMSEIEFLSKVERTFGVSRCDGPETSAPGEVRMLLSDGWRRLIWRPVKERNLVSTLDVSVLQERLLCPILGVHDPRSDRRIDFVGGADGRVELQRRVRNGRAAVAFSMHPVSIEKVMEVSDAGLMMPPKSTWFDPKPRSGLFVYTF